MPDTLFYCFFFFFFRFIDCSQSGKGVVHGVLELIQTMFGTTVLQDGRISLFFQRTVMHGLFSIGCRLPQLVVLFCLLSEWAS